DSLVRRLAVGRLELAHILRQARHALEPRVLPQEIGYRIRAHLLFGHEIKHDARIDLPAAGAHGEPVERGEPHCRGDRAPVMDRAHRSAIAEMGDDHVLSRDLWGYRAQLSGDELIREA